MTSPAHTNRLSQSTSPYLLQHAHNPVDWYEWGEAAFEKAKREDKPIFLSVGYSTCHWCHVMAHESFEDDEVAAILNAHFVAIKVDREQRPDIDSQYMLVTQLMTRRGGWPNSVWLTPDARPWFAGTYFPKHDMYGRPGFITVLQRLADAWRKQRDEIEQQADELADAVRQYAAVPTNERIEEIARDVLEQALGAAAATYDPRHGGFGAAPKFPPHATLAMLARRLLSMDQPDPQLLKMYTHTLDAMARGGVYDHIGFGFHRYSTDPYWLLPHFEKMLYDNAQLIRAYTDGYRMIDDARHKQTVGQMVQWLEREMSDPRGGFYAAIDADSEGEEGKFYVWRHDEIRSLLGESDADLFCRIYNIQPEGNFADEATGQRSGANIPHLTRPLADWADELKIEPDALRGRLDAQRIKLLQARDQRIRPHLDDKVLAAWNGLAIGALAYAGKHLNEPAYIQRAERAARFIRQHMTDAQGRLVRTWRDGKTDARAYLDDYAYLLEGLIELHASTDEAHWRDEAKRLANAMIDRFADEEVGGFFFTADGAEVLLGRSKNPHSGGNVPSPNGVAALTLLRLADVTGEPRYANAARQTLIAFAEPIVRSPQEAGELLLAADEYFRQSGADRLVITAEQPVRAELVVEEQPIKPGQPFDLHVLVDIADGYHVYAENPEAQVIPVNVEPMDSPGVTCGEAVYPPPGERIDPVLEDTLKVYTGRVQITVPVTVEEDAEDKLTLAVKLTWQACGARRCLEPRERNLSIKLPIATQ